MSVQNIECQIAQGQISRYLSGDSFPTTMVTELEKHIAECPQCQEIVNQKKAMLQAMLRMQGAKPVKAVVEMPIEQELIEEELPKRAPRSKPARQTLSQKLVDRIAEAHASQNAGTTVQREPSDKKNTYGKPLMYSLALAAVMVGMSYVMKDPTRLFGDRVVAQGTAPAATVAGNSETPPAATPEPAQTPDGASGAAQMAAVKKSEESTKSQTLSPVNIEDASTLAVTKAPSATPAKTEQPVAAQPVAQENTPAQPEKTQVSTTPAKNPETQKSTPPKAAQKPANKPTAVRRNTPVRRAPARIQPRRTASSSGIRVYDKDGNPIK